MNDPETATSESADELQHPHDHTLYTEDNHDHRGDGQSSQSHSGKLRNYGSEEASLWLDGAT